MFWKKKIENLESALREAAAHDDLMHRDMAILQKMLDDERKKPLEKKYIDKPLDGNILLEYLKMGSCQELIDWLENLSNALIMGTFNKTVPFTKEQLTFRQGEVSALQTLIAKIKEYRSAKPIDEKTEEEENG